jgi:hypothetical protein
MIVYMRPSYGRALGSPGVGADPCRMILELSSAAQALVGSP